ncbi:hypothetical protein NQ314_001540 [Rhamnusium bicolor]|uniref:Uncharacterized protein n=1 Tax=Rhamnusium bicolor TaxID=1586634 RepID=A0AAV8ZRP3_9CUCU|nr:hypothetical protein NQ314_001540 [Rhamnusium bicolor]
MKFLNLIVKNRFFGYVLYLIFNVILGLQNGEDTFSNFISAPTCIKQEEKKADFETVKSEEESFFNQAIPAEKEKVKLDKDSILALYANTPTNNFNQYSNIPQVSYQQQPNFPSAQNSYQSFGGFPQQQTYSVQNGLPPAQWSPQVQQWSKQGQFLAQNNVQFVTNPTQFPIQGQFNSQSQLINFPQQVPANQFLQFQQPNTQATSFNQTPNPFFASQNLQQQFNNLTLSSQNTNTPPTVATNIWQ